jgi:hypothetical protein
VSGFNARATVERASPPPPAAQVRAQGGAVRCEWRAGSRCHAVASKGLFASSWRGGGDVEQGDTEGQTFTAALRARDRHNIA